MKQLTINKGFEHLTDQLKWHQQCKGINASTSRSLKQRYKRGTLGEAKMIELLKLAGYKIIPPKCELPKKKKVTQKPR